MEAGFYITPAYADGVLTSSTLVIGVYKLNKFMANPFESKAKKAVRQSAVKQAERIFMKNNPNMAMKDGSFPKAGTGMPRSYNKEAARTERQVVKTRLKQYDDEQKSKKTKKSSLINRIFN